MTVNGLTIDDARTRDCDDSVWAEVNVEADCTVLTVCVTDVAGWVEDNAKDSSTALERAEKRVETRYWSRGSDPMLPRGLSENELSLLPFRKRRVLVLRTWFTGNLNVVRFEVSTDVLASRAKLSYDSVPGILADPGDPHHEVLRLLERTALGLLEKRRSSGALAFYDLNEGWATTEEGHLLRLERARANVGYVIVQEAMILTNTQLAGWCAERSLPVLYRNHTARSVAPEREEILRQMEQARLDPSTVESLRRRVHAVVNRATYDVVVKGHYGLCLPYYVHATSPLRRFADLVTQRQVRAHLRGDELPYKPERVAEMASHIVEKIARRREVRKDALKDRADEHGRQRVLEMSSERLASLSPKDFERVLRVTLRSGTFNSDVGKALRIRTRDRTLTVLEMFLVLSSDPGSEEWGEERRAVLDHLTSSSHHGPSVCGLGTQLSDWSSLEYEHEREGPDHSLAFRVRASLVRNGEKVTSPEVLASSFRTGKSRAAVSLLAMLTGQDPPTWPKVRVPSPAGKKGRKSGSVGAVNALQEHAQANGHRFPEYSCSRSGGDDHSPEYVCTCTYLERSVTSEPSSSKRSAKKSAALAMKELL